jgi:c-di-GMP-binding flagellar brake protein YcgR
VHRSLKFLGPTKGERIVEKQVQPNKPDYSIQRRWKRFRVELRLKVMLMKEGPQRFTFAQGSDISEGGMAAYIPLELSPGESVEVEFVFPYAKNAVRVVADVVNKNGFRYGMTYSKIDPADRETLMRALKNLELTQ